MDENRLAETFRILDYDDAGHVTIKHLRHFLTEHYNDTEMQRMLDEADDNHDGQVMLEDFLALFKEKEAQNEMSKEDDPLLPMQLEKNKTDDAKDQFLSPCEEVRSSSEGDHGDEDQCSSCNHHKKK